MVGERGNGGSTGGPGPSGQPGRPLSQESRAPPPRQGVGRAREKHRAPAPEREPLPATAQECPYAVRGAENGRIECGTGKTHPRLPASATLAANARGELSARKRCKTRASPGDSTLLLRSMDGWMDAYSHARPVCLRRGPHGTAGGPGLLPNLQCFRILGPRRSSLPLPPDGLLAPDHLHLLVALQQGGREDGSLSERVGQGHCTQK